MIVIPTMLGMLTTLVILSIVIGPPTVVFTARVPPELIIESWNVTKIGKDYALILKVYNPGDEGLHVTKIYVNGKVVVDREIYIEPRSPIRDISFVLPKTKRSKLNVSIVWSTEAGESRRIDIPVVVPKK